MKPLFSTGILLLGALVFSQCNSQKTPEQEQAVTNEKTQEIKNDVADKRQEFIAEMRQVREKADKRIDELNAKMEKSDAKAQKELKEQREDLVRERDKIDNSITRAETTPDEDWEAFRADVQVTFKEIESDLKNFGDKINEDLK